MRKPLRGEIKSQWKRRVNAIRKKYKIGPKRVTLWDVDHITPVIEGGGECGLDQLRTLCVLCHRKETAKLRKRMSKRKNKK
jgi:5-methylcytosine-specific restriction endonuclease McrA